MKCNGEYYQYHRERWRAWYNRNTEYKKQYVREYYKQHKEYKAMYLREYKMKHPLYITWINMKQRCLNPKCPRYLNYGGRGITICDEWLNYDNFEAWCLANGWQSSLTIDKIDNDRGYSPENCQFLTRAENTSKGVR